MDREQLSALAGRRGITFLGCLGIGVGMLALVAILAAFSGWLFYRNFGPALEMARDEIQPVGERFITHMSGGSFAPAYAMLTEDCQKEWEPEKFGDLGTKIEDEMGPLKQIQVDVYAQTVEAIIKDEDQLFDALPMSFPCVFEKGEGTFHLFFRRVSGGEEKEGEEPVWQISGLMFETAEEASKEADEKGAG